MLTILSLAVETASLWPCHDRWPYRLMVSVA